ncbi:ABC transporter permease [Devosia algicola]
MISTQRSEIAVLKAFGYSNLEVGAHYFLFAMVAVLAGAMLGIVSGIPLGQAMVGVYGGYFSFPTLRYDVSVGLIAVAVGGSALAAGFGALNAVRAAVSLPPAEAMRPEQPARFAAGPFERIGLGRILPTAGRMILRNVERQPVRTLFSVVGVAFSVAILVIGMFMFDGVGYMMRLQFDVAQREDLSLTFNQPVSSRVRFDLGHIDGVTRVEPFLIAPARLSYGHRKHEVGITGLQGNGILRQIVTTRGGVQPLPPEGLMISDLLATELGVVPGDMIDVEFLDGAKRTVRAPIAGVVGDFVGISVYANIDALHQMIGGANTVSGAYLSLRSAATGATSATLKHLPTVASVASTAQMLAAFEAQLAQSLYVGVFFILGFSGVIAVAVIYNGARISLSERGRELASMRVLGFSRNEVAVLLFGEQAISTILALPIGCYLGFALAGAVAAGLASETYRIPLIVNPQTYLLASAITVVAALISAWIVRRRLDRMDLIEVLKTRE